MKKILAFALVALFFLPPVEMQANTASDQNHKTEIKSKSVKGKKKPKKNATKTGKPKRKYIYRPGARQN